LYFAVRTPHSSFLVATRNAARLAAGQGSLMRQQVSHLLIEDPSEHFLRHSDGGHAGEDRRDFDRDSQPRLSPASAPLPERPATAFSRGTGALLEEVKALEASVRHKMLIHHADAWSTPEQQRHSLAAAASAAGASVAGRVPSDDEETPCAILELSTKYSERCGLRGPESNDVPLPLLVTGVGRSGSSYLAELLWSLGLGMSHDDRKHFCPCPGRSGAVAWPLAFSESAHGRRCHGAGFRPELGNRRFRSIFLLTRSPLETIASRAGMSLCAHSCCDCSNSLQCCLVFVFLDVALFLRPAGNAVVLVANFASATP
jgi:hypothetical protein